MGSNGFSLFINRKDATLSIFWPIVLHTNLSPSLSFKFRAPSVVSGHTSSLTVGVFWFCSCICVPATTEKASSRNRDKAVGVQSWYLVRLGTKETICALSPPVVELFSVIVFP